MWCALSATLYGQPIVEDAGWPQWRGPSRDGLVAGPAWPSTLGEPVLRNLWRTELGPSYSGPIVGGGLVFTTETRDRQREIVRACDAATGKQVWEASWEGALRVPFFAASNGDWIRATPAFDGSHLYVAGMRDVLVCLDAKTGAEIWRVDFVAKLGTPLPAFGFVSSPLVVGDWIYVQAGAALTKLDKRTGAIVWQSLKDDGGMWGSAFSSPYLATIGDRTQLLVQTRTRLAGVDPDNGTVLWSQNIEAFRGMNILTPTVLSSGVFTSSYGGKSLLLEIAHTNDQWEARQAWTSRLQGYMSTPIVIGQHAYLHLRNQRFACLDLKTGQDRWVTEPFGRYWSMVCQGERILALDEEGVLYLIAASPEKFQLLDSRKISDAPTWAHLALVHDRLYVRELQALAAYRWSAAPE
jgi:outer membrane protein assembly factor BamB